MEFWIGLLIVGLFALGKGYDVYLRLQIARKKARGQLLTDEEQRFEQAHKKK